MLIEEIKNIHEIWYNFCEYFSQWYYKNQDDFDLKTMKPNGKTIKVFDSSLMTGYDALNKVEEYVKSHPEIKIVYVDDDSFAGSDLVLVPHPGMGITAIMIPQCTTQNNTFFLYPNALNQLQETLTKLNKDYLQFEIDP